VGVKTALKRSWELTSGRGGNARGQGAVWFPEVEDEPIFGGWKVKLKVDPKYRLINDTHQGDAGGKGGKKIHPRIRRH